MSENNLCPIASGDGNPDWVECDSECAWFRNGKCVVLDIAVSLKIISDAMLRTVR